MIRENVKLHIEELVLRGFAPGDRYRSGEAAERELARLFAWEDAPPSLVSGGAVPHLDAGALVVSLGSRAGAFGAQVARPMRIGMAR